MRRFFANSIRSRVLLPAAILAVLILMVWSNSLQSPLVFDDLGSIRDNPTIRSPYKLAELINPPGDGGQTVAGRPLLNISFAVDHWLYGEDYSGYRFTNVMIHIANALMLFAIVRFALRQHVGTIVERRLHRWLPLAISATWSLHPLTTTAVSYLVQRAESLAALFLLITLCAFARSLTSRTAYVWLSLSLLACGAGALTKETIAAAPFVVALYAWIFAPRERLRNRRSLYATYFALLFGILLLVFALTISTGDRAGTASLAIGAESMEYLKSQSWAITRYLHLALWPAQLVFDYGRDLELHNRPDWPIRAAVLLLLFSASAYCCFKRSALGFLGLSFFILLAPSSSIFPLADPVFEHRMYLPLALVVGAAAIMLSRLLGRLFLPLCAVCAASLAFATYDRNQEFKDEIALWKSAIQFSDQNARAHTNLGTLYLARGEVEAALRHLRRSVEIQPTPLRHHNFANALAISGNASDAIPHYLQTLEAEPEFAPSILGLAQAYAASVEHQRAIVRFTKMLQLNPAHYDALQGLAQSQLAQGNTEAAAATFQRICDLHPTSAAAFFDLGDALARLRRFDESKSAFAKATELDPSNAQAFSNLGNIFLLEKSYSEAAVSYEKSLAIAPNAMTHTNLAISLIYSRRIAEAKIQIQKALALDPAYPPALDLIKKLR